MDTRLSDGCSLCADSAADVYVGKHGSICYHCMIKAAKATVVALSSEDCVPPPSPYVTGDSQCGFCGARVSEMTLLAHRRSLCICWTCLTTTIEVIWESKLQNADTRILAIEF